MRSLKSYEGTKGFDSSKMTEAIEMLYRTKTQHEDLDEFLESMLICRYCLDKLRKDTEVARSTINYLAVDKTPDCIQQLNIFERSLIKFCVTSITVVRLGQVTNTRRPRNELNAALKGRIAYLPVDVTSNASFLPDKLLSVDNLVLLVGGQPTSKKTVWTSAVDLRKIHKALAWLRENNNLYRDVPAYTMQELQEKICQRPPEDNHVDEEEPRTGALLRKLDEAAKSRLYENFSVQPISSDFPADTLIDYQIGRASGLSENLFDTDLDIKAFPELFPTGKYGMRDVRRAVSISTTDYLRSRLLNRNPKFRLNLNYLFHCFHVQEISNMTHSVGHMLRSVTGNALSARSMLDRLKAKDADIAGKMFSIMANMRGTKEYFSKLAMNVKWLIRELGPPTLFVTCASAEWFSDALVEHIRDINKDFAKTDSMTPAELCAMDPVSVSIHFHKKWKAIFKKLILAKESPMFGHVSEFFWRIEYQSRGAPHVHCLLWIDNAPMIGKDSNDDVKAYIDQISTCSMPDSSSSPTLSALVAKFQTHKCNKYCTKAYKKNGQFYRKCRFGFPRPTKPATYLNDVADCLAVNHSKQPRKRLYHLRRTEQEANINDYNPALLLANQANVDVQYIGHMGSRLPYYITNYITKHERSENDEMWQQMYSAAKSVGTNAMSFLLNAIKQRQVGANEAVDRLLGHKLYSQSRQLRFADLQPRDKACRVLKPMKEVERLVQSDENSTDIFYDHWVLDIYPARPDVLEDVSLHEFLGWYEKGGNVKDVTMRLKNGNGCLRKRTVKPYIVTHPIVNPNRSSEEKERYFYQLLKLFRPWRDEQNICSLGQTYEAAFVEQSEHLPAMVEYDKKNRERIARDEKFDDAIKQAAADQNRLNSDVEDDEGAAFEGCAVDNGEMAMRDVLDAHRTATATDRHSADDLQEAYGGLNVDQKRVVDKVMMKLSSAADGYHLMVSGEGGTGKSRVISVLQRLVTASNPESALPVVVTAPTGLAAYQINGTTIHRLLSLPIEHGKPADYSRLQQEQLMTLRAMLKNLKLIILDEVSMVTTDRNHVKQSSLWLREFSLLRRPVATPTGKGRAAV